MNISTSRTRPPSCMYCLGELSRMVGTPANMLFPSERDSARSSSKPPPRARFLRETPGSAQAQAEGRQTSRETSGWPLSADQVGLGLKTHPCLCTGQWPSPEHAWNLHC